MLTLQRRQKGYVDTRRRDLEFAMGDHVFLKIAPMKRVMRFGEKRKLKLHFIGPFEVSEQIDQVAYRLALLFSLFAVSNVFHVSMLRNYLTNSFHVVDFKPSCPKQILARDVKTLCNREITMFKVIW